MRFTREILTCLVVGALLPAGARAQTLDERESESLAGPRRTGQADKNDGPDLSNVADLAIERTNRFRKEEGLQPVKKNDALTKAARYFAGYMARTDRYGHHADDKTPSERAENQGYDYCVVLENIAWQYSSTGFESEELARKLFQGWKESPEHRKNMLNSAATETGVAVARSSDSGKFYAVQMFGRPQSQAIEFKLTNESETEIRYRLGERSFPLPPRYTRTHRVCRPPELTLLSADGPDDGAQRAPRESKTVHPEKGDHFVVERTEAGELTIREK